MTTITPAWIDELVPVERREEGQRLIAELEAIRPILDDLLNRYVALVVAGDEALRAVEKAITERFGDRVADSVSNGLGEVFTTLDGTLELNAILNNMGFDPDEAVRSRSDYFDRRLAELQAAEA